MAKDEEVLLCERMSKGESSIKNGWGLQTKVDDIAAGVVGAVENVLK